jgi:recombination protein RecT
MATQMQTNKILSLVDVIGSEQRFKLYKNTVEKVLPSHENKDRYWMLYAKIAQEWLNNQKVTDKQSVLTCMFNAVKLGLNPDPVFGEIYFIPYSGKLTYQVGYKGMIKLSINSGFVRDVRSGLIYEKDTWIYEETEKGQVFKFSPNFLAGKDRGKEIFGFSIFEKKDGSCSACVMESHKIDDIRADVLARMRGASTPWTGKFADEMRKKTVIRRHWKMQPKSVEIAQVIEHEEAIERGEEYKVNHPELEGIIDDLIDQSQQQQEEVLPMDEVFGKAKA